ncbi:peroxiredoxin Q/BCP [Thiogranum longum]|uniref:thioredoxin-dependent peroxiredoxin n=1 Tax=Thiogranum longum TaxID=1537524 RepID=A0A4R1HA86_9GAMM|nr:peroxiredoxin [Thiogranum longum]TCK17413.1 peroxiredoxin Q/BCP [Thiogranum longum]
MPAVQLNKKVPDFSAESTGGTFRLSDHKGKNVVIYFYPKDNTSGCTLEGQNFRDNIAKFRRNKTVVVGVSRDSLASHEKFRTEQAFPFELISDKDEALCKLFDVIKEKNMYGKKVMGIERSTFLIDASGKLRREWRKVKVDGHVDEVLEAVRELNRANP